MLFWYNLIPNLKQIMELICMEICVNEEDRVSFISFDEIC